MEPAFQDSIEREIMVSAPQGRVYAAVTDPQQLIHWFPDAIEGELIVGEQPVFTFEGHGKARIFVVDARPTSYFAFRWVPGSSELVDDVTCVATTLVEFMIDPVGEQTRIIMKESGFAALAADVAAEKFAMNSGGWGYMLGRLEKQLA
jgi:uncharacterized protein YndB with AHSA1/START domain